MRITQNNFFNTFVSDQQNIKQRLNSVNRQISSGMKIKYGHEDPSIFTDTLRLDYEEHTLSQAVDVATDAQNFANNTDSVMFQFSDALIRFKTLLLQAANGSNSDNNFYAISNEMKSLKEHLVNLGNSSINGRYLFSGTKLDTQPLDSTGVYRGNGGSIKAVVGAKVEVPYNISGEELFLGEDENKYREVTTNIPLKRFDSDKPVSMDTKLNEITGNQNSYEFKITGRDRNGAALDTSFSVASDGNISDILEGIKSAYGSDMIEANLVNGYITIKDKLKNSSLLDFHLFASDNNNHHIEFIKSASGSASDYDGIDFEKIGDGRFRGNMPQIVKENQNFATGATKLQETSAVDLTGGRTLSILINGSMDSYDIDENTTYRQLVEAVEVKIESVTGKSANVDIDQNGRLVVSSEGLTRFYIKDSASPSVMFSANDALTVDDPKHDLFASIDEAIVAVENGRLYPDGKNPIDPRNHGVENALARIDHMIEHVSKEHTKIGAMSNSLKYAVERSEMLKINVQTLRSEILDTDIGEATMKLNKLSLNFQAMMASVAKVQNLSLVNYL
ncbi:flagellar hook-associated protein FlgL [Hydrogenimonas sp.]